MPFAMPFAVHFAVPFAVPLAVFCLMITSAGWLHGDGRPINEVARGVAESHGDAIVTLAVVMKITLTVTGNPDQTKEQAAEVSGTIVNSKGWVATSYSNIQPQVNPGGLPEGIEANITTDIKEIKIVWADGEESAAEVVLHDSDIDVSIIRPLEAHE